MFDARYFTFFSIAALLVISPGATMAVVMETAVGEGRLAALRTVVGINIGNSSLALASALGLSAVLQHWPWALQVVKVGGAAYLTWLGLRALWFAARGRAGQEAAARRGVVSESAPVVRGIMTNLLNPPVVLFYTMFLPQFIGPEDPFFTRFLLLAATHVAMSLVWLSVYAFALGLLAERFARPVVRRTLEGLTGALLVGFGVRLVF